MNFARHFYLLTQVAAVLLSQSAFAESTIETKSADLPSFTQNADCLDFINENPQRVSCGFIQLPVNHDDPADGTITLPILIAGQTRSLTATPSNKAILIPGGGGPGASIGFGLPYQSDEYLGVYSSLRSAGFDVVIMDQRGTGLAKPTLRCPETTTAFKRSISEYQSFSDSLKTYRVSLNDCRQRLKSENISLQNFDTYQSAKDYLTVIEKLPYEWWGTLATSYATVIAQEMEVLQPSLFNRIVLDSPVAIDYQRPFTFELIESSIQRILSLCEITRRCNRRHEDIKTRFREVVARFKQKSVSLNLDIYDAGVGVQQATLQIDDKMLLDMLILAAYSNYTLTDIPWIIDGLHKGKTDRLKQLATDYWHYNNDLDFASALSWVIHCKERQPMEEAYLRRHPSEFENYSAASQIAFNQERLICTDWHTKTTGNSVQSHIISTETLILAGDLDPVIDRDDIKNTADNFTNKQVKILAGTGHSVWFQSACTRRNVVTFFSQNSSDEILDCTDGISRFK